jgi:hypothetical protein
MTQKNPMLRGSSIGLHTFEVALPILTPRPLEVAIDVFNDEATINVKCVVHCYGSF